MKLPITFFGPPKPEKEITRYFLLKARYKTTNSGRKKGTLNK